jgi:dihydroorotate dehydrogenase electron transfer subunit
MGAAASVTAILGYRDETFLLEDFSCGCVIATEDGSAGTKGNVLDAVRENGLKADVIYACGPAPMLRAIKAYAAASSVTAWVSMEERMACGVGACLGCVVRTEHTDAHSNVRNRRVCADGPVFNASEVII